MAIEKKFVPGKGLVPVGKEEAAKPCKWSKILEEKKKERTI